ncbi:MAG: hypothetical protein ACRD2S_07995, partial [Terriglobales bacterium]
KPVQGANQNLRLSAARRGVVHMKKILLAFAAVSMMCFMIVGVSAGADQSTVKGWVSDSQCGVKGAKEGHEACTKKCLSKGASMVVVSDKDQKILTVDNPDALKEHEGHHVAVMGEVTGDSIHVDSVKMLKMSKDDDKMQMQ